MKSSEKVIA